MPGVAYALPARGTAAGPPNLPGHNPRRPVLRPPVCRANGGSGEDRDDTVRRLEALLPEEEAAATARASQPPPAEQPQGEGWAWFDRPATPPKGPLRQRGTHTGASYIDSESFTRDPLELRVGSRTSLAGGGPPRLPDAAPTASRALAAGVAALGAATLAGLLPPLVLDSDAVLLGGEAWRLLGSGLQPDGVPDGAAAVAALLSGGTYAERRLGRGLFAAAFVLPGASAALAWCALAAAGDLGLLVTCGPSVPLLGPAACLAAFTANNWAVLGEARQRLPCLAAVAALAAPLLLAPDVLAPAVALEASRLQWWDAGLVAAAGGLLGYVAGPNLQVQRELDIADGAMTISGDEEELLVVVDRRTAPARWGPVLLYAAALAAAASGLQGAVQLESEALQSLLDALAVAVRDPDPEVQSLLYELAPDAWDLKA